MATWLHSKGFLAIIAGTIGLQYAASLIWDKHPVLILIGETIPFVLSFFLLRHVAAAHSAYYRWFWNLLSLGSVCYTLAIASWIALDLIYGVQTPILSIGDIFWNLQSIAYVGALVSLLMRDRSIYRNIRLLFDTLILFLIVAAVSWKFVIRPRLADLFSTTTWWDVAITSSYPFADLALFVCLFMIFYSNRFPYRRQVFLWIVLGFAVFILGDMFYFSMVASGTYEVGSWIDLLYGVSVLFFAYAGRQAVQTQPKEVLSNTDGAGPKFKYLLPYSGLIVLLLLTLHRVHWRSIDVILSTAIVTVVLIVIRQVTVLLENDKLMMRLQQALRQAEYLALYDPLSMLPNRRSFERRTTEAINRASRLSGNERTFAVLFLDLDRFKYVNDSYGHGVGDELIQSVAGRLASFADNRFFASRMGGDEFTILYTDVASEQELLELSGHIIEQIGKPIRIGQLEFRMAVSIGISMYPRDGTTATSLLKHADIALYQAKALGRGRAVFYSERLTQELSQKIAMDTELRRALEQEELLLYYQPQIDAVSQELVGVEALIRWKKQSGVMVSPAAFIPLAEETGLIVPIGRWVILNACRQAKQWKDAGVPLFHMSVNVSFRQISEPNFVCSVADILEETGLPPEELVLEITEGTAIQDEQETLQKLLALKQMGVRISMDDFGTGYSSLGYLKLFQVEFLKIAQTFIYEVSVDPDKASIVKAILAMARSLKLTVIAEGVETEEQYRFLIEHGCDWIQGYYFHKPLSAEDMGRLFAEQAVIDSGHAR